HRDAGRLRAGRDGRGLRWDRARSDDLSADDLRDDAGLCGDRPTHDCESGEPVHRFTIAARAHLRSAGRAGWHTPAEGGDTPTTWSTSGSKSHANCGPVA